MAKEKRKIIKTMADFEAEYGNRRVDVREIMKLAGYYETGSLRLDSVLNGGLPMGKITQLYGPGGGGKTALSLSTARGVLEAGGKVDFYDLERGLDLQSEGVFNEDGFVDAEALIQAAASVDQKRRRDSWLRINGIDPENPNFNVWDPWSGEDLFAMLAAQVSARLSDLIIVDSIATIVPRAVLEGNPGEATYGARAKLLSEELPRLDRLYSGNVKTTIIFINQVRENIGAQVKSQKAAGGMALEHLSRTKIKVQRINRTKLGDDFVAESRCRIEKSIASGYAEVNMYISSKRGVDIYSELIEFAEEWGFLHTSGNWHYFFENPVDDAVFRTASAKKKIQEIPGYLAGANGEGAALEYMAANGWKDKILPLAKKSLGL